MSNRSANNCHHNYDTFNTITDALRLTNRIAADIIFLDTLQNDDHLCEGPSFGSLSIDQELEHHCRQRWKIE